MNSLILTYEGFQDQEVVYPYYRLMEEIDDDKYVCLPTKPEEFWHSLLSCSCKQALEELNDNSTRNQLHSECSLMVLPGGVKALEKLRQENKC